MKLTTLRALVAAIEEGSLRSAARRIGVSQQVVYKRIYGVKRNGRSIGGALRKLKRSLCTAS